MKKIYHIIILTLLSLTGYSQVYQSMPQYGYGPVKRMWVDSSLLIPTVCGVPTLKTYETKRAAVAYDSCNKRLYFYDPKLMAWDTIKGGGTALDTTSLSNRINLRVKYSDTAGMLSPYLRKVDTASLSSRINSKADSSINLQKVLKNGNLAYNYIDLYDTINGKTFEIYIAPRDGSGALIGMVDSFQNYIILETSGSAYTNPTITFINKGANQYLVQQDSSFGNLFLPYQNSGAVDTIATLGDITTIDTTSLSNRINQKLNISDSLAMLSPYLKEVDTSSLSSRINLKLNISDTSSMLSPYLRLIDTTNRWVNSVTKLNDSTIRVSKGGTLTDITLTPSSTVTSATRLSTQVYNSTGSTITKGSVVYINGRHSSGLPTVALAQANNENNSYKTFALIETDIATSNSGVAIQIGNIGNLNLPTSTYTDGDLLYLSPTIPGGFTLTKPLAPSHIVKLGSVTRAHPTLGSIQINIQNGWQLDELSDVSIAAIPNDSTLLQFSRVDSLWHDVSPLTAIGNRYIKPTDTLSLSSRINTKLNSADSTLYQTKYRSDTARTNTYNAINTKVNISDTAAMLSNYFKSANFDNAYVKGMQLAGSSIKGTNLALPSYNMISQTSALTNRQMRLVLTYLPTAATLTGIKFYTQGSTNNAGAFNGVALYKVRSGNDSIDLVASCTNDTSLFEPATSNSWVTKAFTSNYSASAGLYYVAILCSYSTGTPSVGQSAALVNSGVVTNMDITPNKISAVISSLDSFGAKYGLSQLTGSGNISAIYLY